VREKDGCRGGSPRSRVPRQRTIGWRRVGVVAFVRGGGCSLGSDGKGGQCAVGYWRGGEESKDAGRPPPHDIPTPRPTRSHPTTRARAPHHGKKKRPAARANPASKRAQPPRLKRQSLENRSYSQSIEFTRTLTTRTRRRRRRRTLTVHSNTRAENHYF